MAYDPEERFSLYPNEGEDVLRKLLGGDDESEESVSEEPEDEEAES